VSGDLGVSGNKGAGIAADIGVPAGTKVYAMMSGTVASTNLCGSKDGMAIISELNSKKIGIAYMHGNNQKFKVGDQVSVGDYIMDSGAVGCNVYSPHLHIGMVYGGNYICPQDVFLSLGSGQQPDFEALVSKGKAPCDGRG
jgi:murein DD-endopeptidase MepM/ murein hydrolase activator NlpD